VPKIALGRKQQTIEALVGTAPVAIFIKGLVSLQRRRDNNELETQHWQL
jgi:hypothetical protein